MAGLLSGLLGVGGGIVMVPGFTQFAKVPLKQAIATSLACVAIFAVPGTITHAIQGDIDWRFALLLAVGVIPGARLGSALTVKADSDRLRLVVAAFLGFTAVLYGAGELAASSDSSSGLPRDRAASPTTLARLRAVSRSRTSPISSVRGCQGSLESAGSVEDGVEHGRGEGAGEGVLLAHVVRAEERAPAGERHLDAVAERGAGAARRAARRPPGRRTTRAPGPPGPRSSSASSRSRNGRHVSRSAIVGLLAGGAQRTGAVIQAPVSRRPSSRCSLVGWLA